MFIVILLVFFTVVVLISLLPLYNRTVYFLIPETFLKLTTASLFFTLTVSFVTFFGFTVTVILDITPELSAAEAVIMVFPACLAVIFPLSSLLFSLLLQIKVFYYIHNISHIHIPVKNVSQNSFYLIL